MQLNKESFWARAVINLNVFDALQFKFVQKNGWNNEINHAFNPLFPLIYPTSLMLAFYQQLLISYVNMILIYRVGRNLFKNEEIAESAGHLYAFSFSIVY